MLEFLTDWGFQLAAGILGATGAAGGISAIYYMIKLGKKVKKERQLTEQDIQITREGIVEAFKTATLPNEVKVSINKQVEDILTKTRDEIIDKLKKDTELTQKAQMAILKILSFTAASAKLTDEEKAEIQKIFDVVEGKEVPEIDTSN